MPRYSSAETIRLALLALLAAACGGGAGGTPAAVLVAGGNGARGPGLLLGYNRDGQLGDNTTASHRRVPTLMRP